jgi:hypothetical protein
MKISHPSFISTGQINTQGKMRQDLSLHLKKARTEPPQKKANVSLERRVAFP